MSEPGSVVPPAADEISGPEEFAEIFSAVHTQICSVLRGKSDEVRLALVCVFSEGHLLVEDVPGVGKTSLAKAIARSLGLSWQRVQFTPDLMPSDLTGSSIFNRATNEFVFRPGGVFSNILLADEINRASPKTQAALLEAMEERQVTVDGTTYFLPEPFVVIATQNPLEHEGTFPLPASELDRFLVRLHLGYPDKRSAVEILQDQTVGQKGRRVAGPGAAGKGGCHGALLRQDVRRPSAAVLPGRAGRGDQVPPRSNDRAIATGRPRHTTRLALPGGFLWA